MPRLAPASALAASDDGSLQASRQKASTGDVEGNATVSGLTQAPGLQNGTSGQTLMRPGLQHAAIPSSGTLPVAKTTAGIQTATAVSSGLAEVTEQSDIRNVTRVARTTPVPAPAAINPPQNASQPQKDQRLSLSPQLQTQLQETGIVQTASQTQVPARGVADEAFSTAFREPDKSESAVVSKGTNGTLLAGEADGRQSNEGESSELEQGQQAELLGFLSADSSPRDIRQQNVSAGQSSGAIADAASLLNATGAALTGLSTTQAADGVVNATSTVRPIVAEQRQDLNNNSSAIVHATDLDAGQLATQATD